ncbi:hypothetical protein K435DRAFT_725740 [Dendrothele bispora CBS 962.96]|uniref:Uncharacterized protein n=1 Tax=Dendrothele bispora (strain CBS 962.96) TaxID=1314807 RepID=A0A4S8LV22_DENBC|nr:hypothetical protein K435DRAFT_725740 [Dendrothele bispora CBS 962.96]
MDRFMLLFLTLFSTYAIWSCPSDEHLDNPVCRSLSQYRTHVLEPYLLPPIQNALSHPSVAPVVSKIHAIERTVTPVVVRTYAIAQPYISKSAKLTQSGVNRTYKTLVLPQYEKYVLPQYRMRIAPYVNQLNDRMIEPYLTPIVVNTHIYTNKGFVYLHRIYTTVQPHVQSAYVRVRPHAQRAWTNAKPHLVRVVDSLQALLTVLVEKLGQLRRLYVDPHVMRIWDKVVELSGPTKTTPVTPAGETKASSIAPTESVSPSQTIIATPSPSPPITQEVETESAAPEETLSIVEPEETAVDAETITETNVEETISASFVAEAEEVLSASSVIVQSISPSSPVESVVASEESIEEPLSEEDDLQSFLDDLGILDETEPEEEVTEEDLLEEVPTNQTPEEAMASNIAAATEADRQAREARKEQTAIKRKAIEDRHRRWAYGLDELIHKKTREVRKELVRLRKGAVKSLGLDAKAKKEQEGQIQQKDEAELDEQLTHIDGEPVGDLLQLLEGEAGKLLKGLEGYLKKEQKEADAEDRLRKWMAVSEKVRSKFGNKVTEMREKVHRWYVGVRDLEVQECVAAATEIKNYAEGAQADLGLDYAWLDDVTYQDWQKYHDLMREFRKFEQEIQLVQNGSHANPPIDPLIPALDNLQTELEDVISGFEHSIRVLGMKIREVLFGPEEDNEPVIDVSEPTQPEEEEMFSILPIDPSPSAPSSPDKEGTEETTEFDASQVILGKGKEQVEEALKSVSVETPAHEEL